MSIEVLNAIDIGIFLKAILHGPKVSTHFKTLNVKKNNSMSFIFSFAEPMEHSYLDSLYKSIRDRSNTKEVIVQSIL